MHSLEAKNGASDSVLQFSRKLFEARRSLSRWEGAKALSCWKEAESLRASMTDVSLPGPLAIQYLELSRIFASWEAPAPLPDRGILERLKEVLGMARTE